MHQGAWITGTGQTPYLRRPDDGLTTDALLAQAADEAMDSSRALKISLAKVIGKV